jgi:gluconolactonase
MIHKLKRDNGGNWTKERIDTDIVMANGGVNYQNGILFCAQGGHSSKGGLISMEAEVPYKAQMLVDSYHGRRFNSVNDVVIKSDGSVWFTDQVYRFEPEIGSVRAVADGFGRPNGLCFSPDEQTLYVTDTDWVHGDGTTDDTRASTM